MKSYLYHSLRRKMKTKIKSTSLFQNVIVGVDFSKYSKLVVKQARQLAKKFDANLIVVHAQSTYNPSSMTLESYVPFIEPSLIKNDISKFYNLKSSSKVSFEVKNGIPSDVVVSLARKKTKPLVVVGSQGHDAVSRFILGSQAEAIALKAKCPVWVHRGHRIVTLKKVLVPTDLSKNSFRLLNKMKTWSNDLGFSTKYMFVRPSLLPTLNYPEYRDFSERLQKAVTKSLNQIQKKNPNLTITTVLGEPAERISKLGNKYDVIAMNPHSRSGLLNKFGRVTSKVIRLTNHPVLVVKT